VGQEESLEDAPRGSVTPNLLNLPWYEILEVSENLHWIGDRSVAQRKYHYGDVGSSLEGPLYFQEQPIKG